MCLLYLLDIVSCICRVELAYYLYLQYVCLRLSAITKCIQRCLFVFRLLLLLLLLLLMLLDVGQLLDSLLLLYFWPVLAEDKQTKTRIKPEQVAYIPCTVVYGLQQSNKHLN